MSKILKNSLSGITILLLFLLAAAHTGMAGEEVPLIPMTVEGVALIDGAPAPVDTIVTARLGGEQVEQFLINTSSGNFCFYISGEAEDTGKRVTFTVDGKDSGESFEWESGKIVSSVELSVGVAASSGNSNKSSNGGSGSLTGTGETEGPETEVTTGSVPLPDVTVPELTVPEETVPETTGSDSGAEQNVEPSADSSEPKSAPGFYIIYAVAGIVLLTFGSKPGRESRRKP